MSGAARALLLTLLFAFVFLSVFGLALLLLPEPHARLDYFVASTLATSVAGMVLFAVLVTKVLSAKDVFFRRRRKEPPPDGASGVE